MKPQTTELVATKGKFGVWRILDGSGKPVYELRHCEEIVDSFDTEREAVSEMELQDRLEVQGRAFGPGM